MHGDANALKAQSFLKRVSSRQKGLWQKIESEQGLEEKPPANFGLAQNPADNLEKLGQFKTTGAAPNIPIIPQGGAKADALKRNLEKIKLPQGFHIGLYALVPDARHMAMLE
jgi:hypothetical protein